MSTTTASSQTREEPKFCAQTFASLASIGILIHFVHEAFTVFGDLPGVQIAVGIVVVLATLGLTAAWYKLGRAMRRTFAAILGVLWTAAASEHLAALSDGGSALDYTGLLVVAAGLALVFAAYWDYHRPMEF